MNGATIKPKLNLVIAHQNCPSNPSQKHVAWFKLSGSDEDSVFMRCDHCNTEIWVALEAVMVEHKQGHTRHEAAGQ